MLFRTRLAPSPTGQFHVGNARTALFSYLIAKSNGGDFILRIEDTDRSRFVADAEERMIQSTNWLGITYDEGPGEIGGKYGPYRQSERLEIYRKYVKQLLEGGHAYYCFCTAERLDLMRKMQTEQNLPPRYDRHCASLKPEEVKAKLDAGEPYVIRMKVPEEGKIKFIDLVRGEIEFDCRDVDDQVLMKSDGFPTYHLAAVVDDHLMEINLVSRTEEWLSSTPKHLLLYQYFGWEAPQFAHLPFVVGRDRSKLSKRKDGEKVWLETYIKAGYLPEAMINFLAFLGWNPGDEREFFTLEELCKEFDITKVHKAGAYFDLEKLDYYNGYYIRKLSIDDLAQRCQPFLPDVSFEKIKQLLPLFQERLVKLSDLPSLASFILTEKIDYAPELLVWKNMTPEIVANNLNLVKNVLESISAEDWNKAAIESKIMAMIAEKGLKNGEVLWPMRVALTGLKASPGPFEVAFVLGRGVSLSRIDFALSLNSYCVRHSSEGTTAESYP